MRSRQCAIRGAQNYSLIAVQSQTQDQPVSESYSTSSTEEGIVRLGAVDGASEEQKLVACNTAVIANSDKRIMMLENAQQIGCVATAQRWNACYKRAVGSCKGMTSKDQKDGQIGGDLSLTDEKIKPPPAD